MKHDDVTAAFCKLHRATDEIKVDVFSVMEHFPYLLMHDIISASVSVDETRQLLFMRKGCSVAGLPSPETALQQHTYMLPNCRCQYYY